MNTVMMPQNAHAYPISGSTALFTSPLMDCTNAIHNSDNIQNSSPYFMTTKSTSFVLFQERLKEMPLIVNETQSPVLPKRHTNDPYRRTSEDGIPCIPKSPYTPEVNFFMSYKDDVTSVFESSSSSASLPTNPTASPCGGSSARGSVRTTHGAVAAYSLMSPPSLPRPRSNASSNGGFTQAVYKYAPFADGSSPPAGFRYTPIMTEIPATNHKMKRVESRYPHNSVSTQPHPRTSGSTVSGSATSVTHVRCKRVHVNGRPVTVWLNEDGHVE